MASSIPKPSQRSKRPEAFISKGRRDMALLLFALLVLFVVLLWFTFSSVREYLNIQEVSVSDYRGMSFDEAERELSSLGLDVRRYAKAAPNQAFNTVVAQSLKPNTMIRQGRVVNLGVHLPEESFNVPNLLGLDEAEAIRLLEYSKLQVGEVRYDFSDLEEGAVVSSSPPTQELLASGANVDLVISRGLAASKIEMPQLVNLPLEEAKKRLQAVGINRIETVVGDANYRRVGQVVNQRPQAGRVTMPSAPVVLYYAMDNPDVVPVPDVTGMSLQQAYEALNAVGLELRGPWITTVNDPNQPQGIIEQQPKGFTLKGTPTYLVVNGADGNLVTPSMGLGTQNSQIIGPDGLPYAQIIGPDGLPLANFPANQGQFNQGQFNQGQTAFDSFGNPIPNTGQTITTDTGPRPVPLPSFITPISQFPQIQADGTGVSNGVNNGQPFPAQPVPNQPQRGFEPVTPNAFANSGTFNGGTFNGGQPVPNFPQQNTDLSPVRNLDIQNGQPIPSNVQPNVNVPIGLSNQQQTQATPTPTQQQQPLAAPPAASNSQVIQPATDSSVRNIPINFNPKNYGFIESAQNEYRLVVIDAQGERELIRRNLGGNDVVNTMVTMYGRGEIQTYVNGSLFQAWSP